MLHGIRLLGMLYHLDFIKGAVVILSAVKFTFRYVTSNTGIVIHHFFYLLSEFFRAVGPSLF